MLWFVAVPFPAVRRRIGLPGAGGSGFWMVELLRAFAGGGAEIHVCWSGKEVREPLAFAEDGVTYHVARETRSDDLGLACRRLLDHWVGVCETVRPDVLDIHGTEKSYGLLPGMTGLPALVHVQGILGELVRHYFGSLGPFERLRFRPLLRQYVSYGIRSVRERRIFETNRCFTGRTSWDRSRVEALNPDARYFHCPEIVREAFRAASWGGGDGTPLFACTASAKPLKGCDTAIRAVAELGRRGIDARLALVGGFPATGYGGWLRALATAEGVADRVEFRAYAEPEEMIALYSRARAFVLPSHIENSPNALAEAMCLGMPCVASDTGGIPDMIRPGTGLLVAPGSPPALADAMTRILDDPGAAAAMGAAAREAALPLHAPESVVPVLAAVLGDLADGAR